VTAAATPRKSHLGEPLKPAELAVLKCYARGLENAGAAEDLNVPFDTVKTRACRAFEKLGARNRTEAVVLAIAAGLILAGPAVAAKPKAKPKVKAKAKPVPVPTPPPRPEPATRAKTGPLMLEIPAALYDELLAVVASVANGRPPGSLRGPATRALRGARAHVRDPRGTTGRAA
jgi:DNA-binding CsgD family transcriptional regulator